MTEPIFGSKPKRDEARDQAMPVSQPLFVKALVWSGVATIVIALVMGGIGYLWVGQSGLISGLIGGGAAGIFFALTLASIVIANRFSGSDSYVVAFFGIVMGAWLLKFVLFIAGSLLLKGQPWIDVKVLFISLIVGVLISLVLDSVVILKTRVPIVALPEE